MVPKNSMTSTDLFYLFSFPFLCDCLTQWDQPSRNQKDIIFREGYCTYFPCRCFFSLILSLPFLAPWFSSLIEQSHVILALGCSQYKPEKNSVLSKMRTRTSSKFRQFYFTFAFADTNMDICHNQQITLYKRTLNWLVFQDSTISD